MDKIAFSPNDEIAELANHSITAATSIKNLMGTDPLTGLYNRRAGRQLLKKLWEESHADFSVFSLVIGDIDHFKAINDKYGHEFGDIYLQKACSMICRVFAHSPVFRLGGDEFAALLSGHDHEQRYELLQEFDVKADAYNAIAQNPWEKISVAKGIAEYNPAVDRTVDNVLSRADQQMYEEKRKRNPSKYLKKALTPKTK